MSENHATLQHAACEQGRYDFAPLCWNVVVEVVSFVSFCCCRTAPGAGNGLNHRDFSLSVSCCLAVSLSCGLSVKVGMALVGGDSRPPTAHNSPTHSGHNSRTSQDLSPHSRHNSRADVAAAAAAAKNGDDSSDDDEQARTADSTPRNFLFSSQPPSASSTPQHGGGHASGSQDGSSATGSPMHEDQPLPSTDEVRAFVRLSVCASTCTC